VLPLSSISVRSVATCRPAKPNTSKRIAILSAAPAGVARRASSAGGNHRRERRENRDRSGIHDTSPPCRGAEPPRLDSLWGALLNARAGDGTGRVAQRESTPFTRVGSQVQSLSRPPLFFSYLHDFADEDRTQPPTLSPQSGARIRSSWITFVRLPLIRSNQQAIR